MIVVGYAFGDVAASSANRFMRLSSNRIYREFGLDLTRGLHGATANNCSHKDALRTPLYSTGFETTCGHG